MKGGKVRRSQMSQAQEKEMTENAEHGEAGNV